MISRMVKAALLDVGLYEEVEHNQRSPRKRFAWVLLVAVLVGMARLCRRSSTALWLARWQACLFDWRK